MYLSSTVRYAATLAGFRCFSTWVRMKRSASPDTVGSVSGAAALKSSPRFMRSIMEGGLFPGLIDGQFPVAAERQAFGTPRVPGTAPTRSSFP